jgi:hypothetical protein
MTTPADPEELSEPVRALAERLNRDVYERSPAEHFRARADMVTAFADGTAAAAQPGTFTQAVISRLPDWSAAADDGSGIEAAQLAVTVEAFMLAHHAAESLLQQLFAHLDARPQSPTWLVLSLWDSKFKGRVANLRDKVDDEELRRIAGWALLGDAEQLSAQAAAADIEARLSHVARWLREAAEFHLHTGGGYNAAKHGLSAVPAFRHVSFVRSDEGRPVAPPIELFAGAALLSLETNGKARERTWQQVARLVDGPGLVAMTLVLADLMDSLWQVGRARALGVPAEVSLIAGPSPSDLRAGHSGEWGEIRLPLMTPPKMSDEASGALMDRLASSPRHQRRGAGQPTRRVRPVGTGFRRCRRMAYASR